MIVAWAISYPLPLLPPPMMLRMIHGLGEIVPRRGHLPNGFDVPCVDDNPYGVGGNAL